MREAGDRSGTTAGRARKASPAMPPPESTGALQCSTIVCSWRWPTGNPCPDYNGDERKGDNLFSSSVLALDPETGTLRWHYQFTPHDLHDWDANQTPMLVDAQFHGAPRKLLVQGN